MADWLPFIVSGLVVGSIYAIAAMGLVVTYWPSCSPSSSSPRCSAW